MNASSSRSHCLTDIYIDLPPTDNHKRSYTIMGRMTLVDLAGSERLKETKNSGEAGQEAGHINKSLFVLGAFLLLIRKTIGSFFSLPYDKDLLHSFCSLTFLITLIYLLCTECIPKVK